MAQTLRLLNDTVVKSHVTYEPNCQNPYSENPIPRWATKISIYSESEQIHLDLNVCYLEKDSAGRLANCFPDYLLNLIKENDLNSATDLYRSIKKIKTYLREKFGSHIDYVSVGYRKYPGSI